MTEITDGLYCIRRDAASLRFLGCREELLCLLEPDRVRDKKQTIYCYNEKARDRALGKLRGGEVTRFKGLGEISPKEFDQFIDGEIRLVPVFVKSMGEVNKCLDFYMGRNTPQRKSFIVENLVVEA